MSDSTFEKQDGNAAGRFSCFLCDSSGFTAPQMALHVKLEHHQKSTTAEDSAYSCLFCLYTTASIQDLQSHINGSHPEQVICLSCFITFFDKAELQSHQAESHANDLLLHGKKEGIDSEAHKGQNKKSKLDERTRSESPSSLCYTISSSKMLDADMEVDHVSVNKNEDSNASLCLTDCPSENSNASLRLSYSPSENSNVSLRLTDCPSENNDNDEGEAIKEIEENYDEESNFSEIVNSSLVKPVSSERESHQVTVNALDLIRQKTVTNKPDTGSLPEKSDPSKQEDTTQKTASGVKEEKNFICPFCLFRTMSEGLIQQHVNKEHMDDGEKDGDDDESSFNPPRYTLLQYSCPFCAIGFDTPNDLSRHINTKHPDGEIGGGSSSHDWNVAETYGPDLPTGHAQSECPVCFAKFSATVIAAHVESHFATHASDESQSARDHAVASKLQEKENKLCEVDKPFQQMQAKYWMDSSMTAKQQFEKGLEQAVSKGKITTREFHQKKIVQAQSIRTGIDDGSTQVPGILEKLRSFYDSKGCPRTVVEVFLSNSTHHYSGSFGDKGWGCGYRNFQMILSCLVNDPTYRRVLFNDQPKLPSIQKLQQLLEIAWQKGFDPVGQQQLGGSVVNTRKWIGATEIVATLSSLRIKCRLLDFTQPSGPHNTHPALIEWVRDYFMSEKAFKPPLYLQHQGHSRTIVGVEQLKNGENNLLIFDPGVPKYRMEQFHENINYNLLQTVRKTVYAFRAKQYQIVSVVGVLDDREYEASKSICSTKIT